MAVALNPNAFLVRTAVGSPSSFSWCGWTRIDTDRGQFTILRYLAANVVGGGGFQFTVDSSRKLIIYRANAFVDLLGGAGPTLAVGDWWFLGITTIVDDVPNNVVLYRAQHGAGSLTQTTVSYSGQYQYANHYIGARPGNDGQDGAFRLDGSVAHDRVWHGVTLTPSEMLAEYQSETAVKAGAWAVWPMADSATVIEDATANNRDLTSTPGTGSIVTTTGPSFGGTDGTATPSTIALTAGIPRPSTNTGAGPSTVAATAALPRPSTGTGAGPSTVAATAEVPTPQPSAGATAAPTTIAATAVLPTPGLSSGVSPAPVAVVAAIPTPAATGGSEATATPATIAVAAGVNRPSVGVSAGPTTLAATVSLPPVTTSSGVAVTPLTIALALRVGRPSVTGGGDTPAPPPSSGDYREPAPGIYAEPASSSHRETSGLTYRERAA